MSRLIVADSSPLIALLNIGRIEWLKILFELVIIPPKVAEEVERKEAKDSVWFRLKQTDGFIQVKPVEDDPRLTLLRVQLDPGESEAILLAQQLALPLLIDERAGREVAKMMGLEIRGLVGVLYALKQKGYVAPNEMQEIVSALEAVHFRMSSALRNLLLE